MWHHCVSDLEKLFLLSCAFCLHLSVWVLHRYMVLMEAGEGIRFSGLELQMLWADMWILGSKPVFSARAKHALHHCGISPAWFSKLWLVLPSRFRDTNPSSFVLENTWQMKFTVFLLHLHWKIKILFPNALVLGSVSRGLGSGTTFSMSTALKLKSQLHQKEDRTHSCLACSLHPNTILGFSLHQWWACGRLNIFRYTRKAWWAMNWPSNKHCNIQHSVEPSSFLPNLKEVAQPSTPT